MIATDWQITIVNSHTVASKPLFHSHNYKSSTTLAAYKHAELVDVFVNVICSLNKMISKSEPAK